MRFDAWKDEPYESLEDAFPDIQADFEDYYYRENKWQHYSQLSRTHFACLATGLLLKTVLKSTQLTISCGGRLK
jgi:hypothetical protein